MRALALALLLVSPLAAAASTGEALDAAMGPRAVRYVVVPAITFLPCFVGAGPADANGACFWFEREEGERLVLRAADDAGPGAIAVFLMMDDQRGGSTRCVDVTGVEVSAGRKLMAWIQADARCGRAPTTGVLELAREA